MADVAHEPKIRAENKPWYLLATLHGEPSIFDDELAVKNRVTWNRWMASQISDDLKASLLKAGRYSDEELAPLSEEERRDIQSKIGNDVYDEIDFSGLEFEKPFFATGFIFPKGANFARATFSEIAGFEHATFSGGAHFANAKFITATFVNAEMKSETSFNGAKFATPPRFFGAKLHEGATWHDVKWPMRPGSREAARQFIDAYERLKLEMDRLKKHGDELDFFALEQQCRRVLLGWKGLPIAVYGFLSGYGRSYLRPLSLIGATVLVGTFFFVAHLVGFWIPALADPGHTGQAIGLSFANTFGILGIRKDLIDPTVLQGLPGWLKVISTIQTILGIVLLFLFGLAIRNRFRMK